MLAAAAKEMNVLCSIEVHKRFVSFAANLWHESRCNTLVLGLVRGVHHVTRERTRFVSILKVWPALARAQDPIYRDARDRIANLGNFSFFQAPQAAPVFDVWKRQNPHVSE